MRTLFIIAAWSLVGCDSPDPETDEVADAASEVDADSARIVDAIIDATVDAAAPDACTTIPVADVPCCERALHCTKENCRNLVPGGCDLIVDTCSECSGGRWKSAPYNDSCFFGCRETGVAPTVDSTATGDVGD